jgi:hypothetical protein
MNSTELRAVLADLETASEHAGAQLIQAEADHRTGLRRSVQTGDYTVAAASEAALAAARVAFDRAKTSTEVARDLLTEATKREKTEAQDAARAKILSQLDGMAALAREGDEAFATLVGVLRRLQATETDLHTQTRNAFSSPPWRAPQTFAACRPLASFLSTVANGVVPDIRPFVADAIADARQNIEAATSA